MQNFDELAEGFHGLVEGTHFGWGKPVDSFTRGDTATMTLSDEQGEAMPHGWSRQLPESAAYLRPADKILT